MSKLTALYDANVLYPAPLRDLLVYLALTDLFRAKWTNDIHEEWIRNVLKNRPDIKRAQLERTRRLMDETVEDGLVSGYEDLLQKLALPDVGDRHVLAAAITAEADVIVTYNLRDFPDAVLKPHGIEAQHPDTFIAHLFDLDTDAAVAAVKEQRANLKRPPMSAEEMLETFKRQGLSQTVLRLREVSDLI